MALLGFIVVLFVVRPLVRRIVTPEATAAPPVPRALAAAAGAAAEEIQAVPSPTAKMIDIAQVQGQVHAQSIQKVGELATRNPNETALIVRQWLHEPAS
jgi:flagellar M-ring protein FliF